MEALADRDAERARQLASSIESAENLLMALIQAEEQGAGAQP